MGFSDFIDSAGTKIEDSIFEARQWWGARSTGEKAAIIIGAAATAALACKYPKAAANVAAKTINRTTEFGGGTDTPDYYWSISEAFDGDLFGQD